jgi:hypothetical protein
MRRFVAFVCAAGLVLGLAIAADAARPARLAEDASAIQNGWLTWAVGSSTNPLLQDGFCGEVVGDRFFLNAALGPGRAQVSCEVPAGMTLVGTPAGAFGWNESDDDLLHGNLRQLKGLVVPSINVKVDGAVVPRGAMVCPEPIDVELEPGNLLETIDPAVTGDSTRASICGWFYVLGPLSTGQHTVLLSDKFAGEKRFEVLFDVTVS